MVRLYMIVVMAFLACSCNNKQKNEEVKEDIKQRIDKVEEKVDENMDKVKERLKEVKDTVKSKIHRATVPDSQP
ncbi:MAG TPA: hypothetical protein VGO58_17765 [Chitinophagaceae bacterium]|nr:hypothetical protein [Chitinophagaceae bacterium]